MQCSGFTSGDDSVAMMTSRACTANPAIARCSALCPGATCNWLTGRPCVLPSISLAHFGSTFRRHSFSKVDTI